MNEREVVDRCVTERGELQLQRRDEHYEIVSNGTFLMATYNGDSERLLVQAALDAVPRPRRVLIGGLGVGFSLAQALANPNVEEVTVVEIESRVITWNRTHLAAFSNDGLADARTEVVEDDLVRWLRHATSMYDAICLDIDNGPDWTVADDNEALYGQRGIRDVARVLAPGGVVAYWSAGASPVFIERLQRNFAWIEERQVPQQRGEPDYVYLASRPLLQEPN